MNSSALRALHLKSVSRDQRRIHDAFLRFIRKQIRVTADEVKQTGVANFRTEQWDAELKETMRPPLARTMYEGAFSELATLSKTTASDAVEDYDLELPPWIGTELPQWLVDSVEIELRESFAQPYWTAINSTTKNDVESVLQEGITEGWSTRRMAAAVQKMGGQYSRHRAFAVASTESSRMRNAGHVLGIQGLQDELGVPIGKVWLSIRSNTTRPAHAALDGAETETADGMFVLNGVETPYPSHHSLPASDAINCLCSVLSSIAIVD